MRIEHPINLYRSACREDGFTMIVAILVMFITSLLVAGAFVAANGDIKLTRTDTSQKQAYYAAMAGVARYKYQLNAEPSSWIKCPSYSHTVTGASEETYIVKTLPASKHTESECKAEKQAAIVESSGSESNRRANPAVRSARS
jgi:Tfp pilus assembly protein PilX